MFKNERDFYVLMIVNTKYDNVESNPHYFSYLRKTLIKRRRKKVSPLLIYKSLYFVASLFCNCMAKDYILRG